RAGVSRMILVTGAGGKTGKAVIKALVARGAAVRAFVRSPAHEAALTTLGAAATRLAVPRLVYHSVLHPQIEAMPHHWAKLRVEEMLFGSTLDATILQPTAYMQNSLAQWELMTREGVYRVPYPIETRLSLVDLDDVAEAAAQVLLDAGHAGA